MMKNLTNLLKLLPIIIIVIYNFSLNYLIYFFLLALTYKFIHRIYISTSSMRNVKAQFDAIRRANALMDWETYNDIIKRHEFCKQTILNDESLTEENKIVVMKTFNRLYDHDKVLHNKGIRRSCENCQEKCLATYYCEHCIRNYLKANLSNWTSGNDEIDNLIRKYQMESHSPDRIVEWIPYDNLQNIRYLTEGECSEIYSATWVNGFYNEWNAEKQQIVRSGACPVVLKKLDNIENINENLPEEVYIYLKIFIIDLLFNSYTDNITHL
jgi:hypothetical protein